MFGLRLRFVAVSLVLMAAGCKSQEHATVAVVDAPASEARSLTLEQAKVLYDVRGTFKLPCAPPARAGATPPVCTDSFFTVFAVVPTGWTKADPVTAWVTCAAERLIDPCEARVRALAGSPAGKVAVRVGDGDKLGRAVSGWEKAVDDAVAQHGVIKAARAPVVSLAAP